MNEKNYLLGNEPSAIRELFEYGRKRKQEIGEDHVFDFSIGNPSVPAPKEINDILVNLIQNDRNNSIHSYTSAPGNLGVRNVVADYLNKKYSANVKGEHIFLTCGAAASLAISFNAILNEGDEVILFAPFFPEYRVFIEHAKGKVVVVKPNKDDFSPDFDDLENKINAKTKIVLVNSPNNPTGAYYSEEVIQKIAKLLKKKEQEYNKVIYFLSDEPYRELLYENENYPFITRYYDNSLVCYSYSKSLSLPGERIGYIALNENCHDVDYLFKAISGAARSLGYICAPSLFQQLIGKVQGLTSNIEKYKTNRNILYQALTKIGYEVVYPKGAFYMFVKALESDAKEFSNKAKEFELLLVPSDSFGYPGYVRISYCVSRETIENSIPFFEKLYQRYKW